MVIDLLTIFQYYILCFLICKCSKTFHRYNVVEDTFGAFQLIFEWGLVKGKRKKLGCLTQFTICSTLAYIAILFFVSFFSLVVKHGEMTGKGNFLLFLLLKHGDRFIGISWVWYKKLDISLFDIKVNACANINCTAQRELDINAD